MTEDIPIFYTKLEDGQRSFKCPICRVTNLHGYPEGHRVSHCPCWPNGYELKDQNGR